MKDIEEESENSEQPQQEKKWKAKAKGAIIVIVLAFLFFLATKFVDTIKIWWEDYSGFFYLLALFVTLSGYSIKDFIKLWKDRKLGHSVKDIFKVWKEKKLVSKLARSIVSFIFILAAITNFSGYNGKDFYRWLKKPAVVQIESISLYDCHPLLKVNQDTILKAVVLPANATNPNIIWLSSDTTVVIINNNGKVTAKKAGKTIVTAMNAEDNSIFDKCVINVVVPLESVSLNQKKLPLYEQDKTKLDVIFKPENATNKTVIWSSSDKSVATVDQNGTVTAVKVGTTIIKVRSTENSSKFDNCTITVRKRKEPPPPPATFEEALAQLIDVNLDNGYRLDLTKKTLEYFAQNAVITTFGRLSESANDFLIRIATTHNLEILEVQEFEKTANGKYKYIKFNEKYNNIK